MAFKVPLMMAKSGHRSLRLPVREFEREGGRGRERGGERESRERGCVCLSQVSKSLESVSRESGQSLQRASRELPENLSKREREKEREKESEVPRE